MEGLTDFLEVPGYGDGYGDGSIKEFNGKQVNYIDKVPTIIESVRGSLAKGYILGCGFSLRPCWVAKVGRCFAHGDTARDAVRDATAKDMEERPIEKRVAAFVEKFGNPDAQVPFADLYEWHHTLTSSCKAGRDSFVRDHGLDIDGNYTPRFFISITRNAYGSEAIAKLAEAYGID